MSIIIICEERHDCRDKNINRWACNADAAGVCPVKRCGAPGPETGDPS